MQCDFLWWTQWNQFRCGIPWIVGIRLFLSRAVIAFCQAKPRSGQCQGPSIGLPIPLEINVYMQAISTHSQLYTTDSLSANKVGHLHVS